MQKKGKDMEFLREVLGEELYSQFASKLNEYNGNEANKEKQIKLANLGTGEYVGKGKHDALQELLNGKETELTSANELIAKLKKDNKDNEDLQNQITNYETENAKLQAELQETKLKSAIKVALLSEKAVDVGYLTYKLEEMLKEKGETLELDENDNIKGWDARLTTLKTSFPTMFGTGDGGNGGFEPVDGNGLPNPNPNKTVTKEQFMKMGYEERVQFKKDNESLYKQYTGK